MDNRRIAHGHSPWKRYFTLIAVLLVVTFLSAILYKIHNQQNEGTIPVNNAPILTKEALDRTNLLFKSEVEIEAAPFEEQKQAASEFGRAMQGMSGDDFLDLKTQFNRMREIERKEDEIHRRTIVKYLAYMDTIEQRRREWESEAADRAKYKKIWEARDKEIEEYKARNFRFDKDGNIIAFNRNGAFIPVEELLKPKQDIRSNISSDDLPLPIRTPIKPVEPISSEPIEAEIPDPEDFLDISSAPEVPAFLPDTFRDTFTEQVLDWNTDFNEAYRDIVLVPHLTQDEFAEFYPTEESRQILQTRQQQMQAEIAQRVEDLLFEDTGNREEKLSIIHKTLSENWSPDIADGVLERLK